MLFSVPVSLFACLRIIICCVSVYLVVGGVSKTIGGWLHEPVGDLLGCHYFMGQWEGSG